MFFNKNEWIADDNNKLTNYVIYVISIIIKLPQHSLKSNNLKYHLLVFITKLLVGSLS